MAHVVCRVMQGAGLYVACDGDDEEAQNRREKGWKGCAANRGCVQCFCCHTVLLTVAPDGWFLLRAWQVSWLAVLRVWPPSPVARVA